MRPPEIARSPDKRQSAAGWLRIGPLAVALPVFVVALAPPQVGHAQERWRGDRFERHDIRRFHDLDFGRWRGGLWRQGWHGGRFGWWWVVPGFGWYYYAAPVYPYPDPYLPPQAALPVPAGGFWYYCASPPGYYPYVPECYGSWQPFPAR
jgi:hypothetical protein